MKFLALLFAVIFSCLPPLAFASGFHLPWWADALFFLIATPGGWVTLGISAAALGYVIYRAVRK